MRCERVSTIGFVITAILVIGFIIYFCNIDDGMRKIEIKDSGVRVTAVNMFAAQLEAIGSLSLTLIGAFLALLIYGESKLQIRGYSKVYLVFQTIAFFVVSFLGYFLGQRFLISRLFYHGSIDLEAPVINFWIYFQIVFFVMGLVWAVVTIIICSGLMKQRDPK
jgi:sterol desaturase/sphingolipid hydroxylase (fatty acid hydroxylase superfamily)